jgi:ribonucleoside-diphosphate reductase alpha chain
MSKNIYEDLSEERKELQEQGLVPEWYSTASWQMFKEKYLYEASSVREQFERIASTAAKHLKKIGKEKQAKEKFFEMLWNGWLSPSTPVLANMGTNRGMPVSCSGGYIGDSIDGFYTSRRETALLTKYGFGTSGYLGDIRPRGSDISVGGKASGVVPVFRGFVQDMRDVAQGTARRGAWAGYLPIDHGDFDELADFIQAEPDDANVGWIVTDEFISRLNSQDEDAIRRYQKALKLKMVTGKGYFSFIDKVNRKRPQTYTDRGLEIKASNLCLRGDTIIEILDSGISEKIKICDFVEKYEMGFYTNATVKSYKDGDVIFTPISGAGVTGQSEELIRIESDSGKVIECTPNHLIFTKNRGWVEAQNLKEDDELMED